VLGVRTIDPGILDLGTRRRRVDSFTFRPLYPQGKSPWQPLDRRLDGQYYVVWKVTGWNNGKRVS